MDTLSSSAIYFSVPSPAINNMAYLRRYAEWVVLEKIQDNSLGENETESRPKNKHPRFPLYPISSFVDITLGSWPSSHLTRMNDYFWQSKWTHHGDNLLSTFSVHTPPAGHNSPPFKIARSNFRNQFLAAMTSWGRNKRSIDEHAYAWRIFAAGIRAPASGNSLRPHIQHRTSVVRPNVMADMVGERERCLHQAPLYRCFVCFIIVFGGVVKLLFWFYWGQ